MCTFTYVRWRIRRVLIGVFRGVDLDVDQDLL
jgi:hypothetical protein